ncbi:MAG: protein kinase domain-containing protein [Myxococcota bacterium]
MTWDGRYRLERTLGEGGMGRVLLARDLARNEHPVAVKILLPEYRDTTTGFMQEFVTQRSFEHPNVPKVYELGFARHPRGGEVPYFTLEYCPGISLISAIPRADGLDRVWPWMIQVLRALDYIHDRGWLHRDLKPGNVLVDMESGDGISTHLIDLGVASRLGDPPEELFIGTPEYCSPEVLAGFQFDQRSDLYSFGLLLYEAIERRRPWSGSDEQELLDKRLHEDPPAIAHPQCPPAVEDLIRHLLLPRMEDRPASAAEVIVRLADATGSTAPIETPVAFGRRLAGVPFPGRERAMERGHAVLHGVAAGVETTREQPRALLVQASRGHEADRVVHELADRAAVQGARVVRVRLEAPSDVALTALQPALDVLRRLREEGGDRGAAELPGVAGAAALLTRLHDPTVVVLEGLQRADRESLDVLRASFTGSRVANLRLLATVDPEEDPVAPKAFARLASSEFAERTVLDALSVEDSARWIEDALGRGVMDVPLLTHVHAAASGRPAGLVAALQDLFRRGVLTRSVHGYAVRGDAHAPLGPVEPADVGELDMLLASMRHAMPRDAVEGFLGRWAPHLAALVAQGRLVQRSGDRFAVGDEVWRRRVYRRLSAVTKMRAHRRLARALHGAEAFPGQRSLVAAELIRSDRPVLAAPHLVVAASEAVGTEEAARAQRYLDKAAELLDHHVGDAEERDAWRWWVMLWKARVRLATTDGDVEVLEEASEALVELGTDAAHVPTLRFALETRMAAAWESRDWSRLVRHAEARMALDGAQPGPDARGLFLWAEALRLRAFGETRTALDSLAEGLSMGPPRPRTGVLLRLAVARADILVEVEWVREARKAVAVYRQIAEAAGERAHRLRVGILEAVVERQGGRPEAALGILRGLARELPADHLRGVSSRLELELARMHLAFGWSETARDHASQARSLAERDRWGEGLAAAGLVEATALRLQGQRRKARERTVGVVTSMRDDSGWTALADARLQLLDLLLADGDREAAEERRRRAQELAAQAERRQEYPRAARAWALASEAATTGRDPGAALEDAERAVAAADRRPGHEEDGHRLLYILAMARRRARRHRAAQALEQRAIEHLRRIAASIGDDDLRRDWLRVPAQAAVLGLTKG